MDRRLRFQLLSALLGELSRVRAELVDVEDRLSGQETRGAIQSLVLGRALEQRAMHLVWQIQELRD